MTSITQLSVNTIRTLSMDGVENAQHGHPGMPMGAAAMAYSLWKNALNINPTNPNWFNRDRFVLSAGHGSMLLYSLLHLSGFDIPIDELKKFRKTGSITPGHPEYGVTPGVDITTGPLGQGIAASVGIALAERHLASQYNKPNFPIVDHYTYVVCGDGDLMEGVSSEASSFAGHLKLDRLIVLYDSNDSSLDGELNKSYSENVKKRFEAQNWQYLFVEDGNDVGMVADAIKKAKEEKEKPTIIEIKTTIGYGAASVEGTSDAHSDPLGAEEVRRTKEFYGWHYEEAFHVPEEVYHDFESIKENGQNKENDWNNLFEVYQQEYPEEGKNLKRIIDGNLPIGWDKELPTYKEGEELATRVSASQTANALANNIPELIGGSADLGSSTKTTLTAFKDVSPDSYEGRNIWYGVREFAMGAIANGLALHGLKPFVSTFFVFSDYLRPAIRLASLMKLPVTYVFTHDSIAVGQDGPTHQPVEHIASFRSMPGVTVIRPADANETKVAWRVAIEQKNNPTILVLGRQNVPTLEQTESLASSGVVKGAYTVSEATGKVQGILLATGSEVQLALQAQKKLVSENIHVNVVSMPSWDLFEQQSKEYQDRVLPKNIKKRLSIELGSKQGWREYVGDEGAILSVDVFGDSGPGEEIVASYGFTIDNIVDQFKKLLND